MTSLPQPVVYLALRSYWEELQFSYACVHEPGEGTPILAFRNRSQAAARCEEWELTERLKTDPLTYSRHVRWSPPENRMPPRRGPRSVRVTITDRLGNDVEALDAAYWHEHKENLPPERLREVWDRLGGGQFFEVAAVELEGEPTDRGAVHVVRRLAWVWDELGLHLNRSGDFTGRLCFGRPDRAFTDRLAAQAFRSQCERQARVGENPFAYAGESSDPVAGRASLDYPLLRDWLLDCGVPRVPKATAGGDVWLRWWKRYVPGLSPLQQAKAWEAFDRIRFFEVVEVDLAIEEDN